MVGASQSASLSTATSSRPQTKLDGLLYFLLAFTFFYPHLVALMFNVRLVVIGICLAICVWSFAGSRANTSRILFALGSALYILACTSLANFMAITGNDPLLATNIQRLLVVTPICLVTGLRIVRSPSRRRAVLAYVWVAAVTSVLALIESIRGTSLFGRSDAFQSLIRDSSSRALLGSDHALVLGALLALAVPMLCAIPPKWRLGLACLLIAGTYSTGSRGPTILAVVFAILVLWRSLSRWLRSHPKTLMVSAFALIFLLGWLSAFVWTTDVPGATGADYSTNYRWALYASLPSILESNPFGYGLGTLPAGIWLVQSQAFGVQDLLTTVDSEVVYSAFTLGWVGVVATVSALVVAVAAISRNETVGLTATMASAIGFFLALHAWDSIGPMWIILTGAALGVLTLPDKAAASKGRCTR